MTAAGEKMMFIVGVGRSGTSLLQSMLNAHPQICFPPETAFVRRYLATGLLRTIARDGGPTAVADHLIRDDLVGRLGLTAERLAEACGMTAGENLSPADLYLRILRAYAENKGHPLWLGDKDPRCVEFLPLLRRNLPAAHILHMIRDPRDVLASKKRVAWASGRSTLRHVLANRMQLKMGRALGPELFGDRYLEVVYEQLIADPAAALRSICEPMAIPFDPTMLQFADSSTELVAREELAWKKETLGPLLASNVGKWENLLTPWEAALTERACGEAFDAIGYPRSAAERRLGWLARLSLIATSSLLAGSGALYGFLRRWRQNR